MMLKKIVFFVMLAVSCPSWSEPLVSRSTFKKEKGEWVVLNVKKDKTLEVVDSCSASVCLVPLNASCYYLYTKVRKFCLFGEGSWETADLLWNTGIVFNNQEENRHNLSAGTSGTSKKLPLPRPFSFTGDEDLVLNLKASNDSISFFVTCQSLEKDPAGPTVQIDYSVSGKSKEPLKYSFPSDSLKMDSRSVSLNNLVIGWQDGLVKVRGLFLKEGDKVLELKNEGLRSGEPVVIGKTFSNDFKIVVSYDYFGADYEWHKVENREFNVILPASKPPCPFLKMDWKSLLYKLLAVLTIVLSALLLADVFPFRKRNERSRPSEEEMRELDVKELVAELDKKKSALEEMTLMNQEQQARNELLQEDIQRLSQSVEDYEALKNKSALVEAQLDRYKADLEQAIRQYDALRDSIPGELSRQKEELETGFQKEKGVLSDRVEQLEQERKQVDDFRKAEVARRVNLLKATMEHMTKSVDSLTGKAKRGSLWKKTLETLPLSFIRFSEQFKATLASSGNCVSFLELASRLQGNIELSLADRSSWANMAVRLYSYFQQDRIRKDMLECGLPVDDICSLYHEMRFLFAECGVVLDAPPRLFVEVADDRYISDNMDLVIPGAYPSYKELLTGKAIVDILKIGYTLPDGRSERGVVASSYTTPSA